MKPKTYNFKGKTVIAVPEIFSCQGCIFHVHYKDYMRCKMDRRPGALEIDLVQNEYGMPQCGAENIIFKLATDENL